MRDVQLRMRTDDSLLWTDAISDVEYLFLNQK